MSAVHKLPVEYEKAEKRGRAPVVTLIGSDLPDAYLDEAEPSPLMDWFSGVWRAIVRLFKLSLLGILLFGYPTLVALSHKVDAEPVVLSQVSPWSSVEVGTAFTLVGRELSVAGIAADRPWWHPQARLTALPAWQEGLASSLSDYMVLTSQFARSTSGAADVDLMAAGRLLAPVSDADLTPRLTAAAEALLRYEGRLEQGLASTATGSAALEAKLDLYRKWAVTRLEELEKSADRAEAWPASRADIETIYLARASAHVSSQLLEANLIAEPGLISTRAASETRDEVYFALRRAAGFNPVFISSQAGTGRILSDHPATMAYYLAAVVTSIDQFKSALSEQGKSDVAVAELPGEE